MPEADAKPVAILLGGEAVVPYVFPDSLIQEMGEYVTWSLPPEETTLDTKAKEQFPALPPETEYIFATWGMPKLDAALLGQLPNLKAVFYAAGSVKYFVTEASWKRGIRIFSAARINAVPVAEFTLARILLGLKQTDVLRMRDYRDWETSDSIKHRMRGNFRSRVGLISYGSIARLVRKHLQAFDHEVWVHDPFLSEEDARSENVRLVGLEEIFRECHAVSLHAPLLEETIGLITGEHFASMQEHAVFINTARGAIIREREMAEVLQNRTDLTAYLDVIETEPPVQDNLLFRLPNVFVTPHIAGSMGYECERMAVGIFGAFKQFLGGQASKLEIIEPDLDRIA